MTVKAMAQETIIDITDAYSVYLTCASYTFPGTTTTAKAGSCTTNVIAMRGTETVDATINTSGITKPSGVSVSVGNNNALTISVTTSVTTPGKVSIPVTVDGQAEFTLEFSFGIAFTGATGAQGIQGVQGEQGIQGEKGDKGDTGAAGKDAIAMVITSSNGTIFKNANISTTLIAHVYKGGVELTSTQISALGTVKWYKDGATTAAGTGLTFNLSSSTVNVKTNIVAQLEG